MTENHLHPDLSVAEEYTRSGHSFRNSAVNVNAEGYIEPLPALNVPGGLALAGYEDCHVVPAHYSFLGVSHVPAMVKRLIDCLFIIEHDLLKQEDRLYPLVEMAAARIIGAYNQLLSMVGPNNWIVKTIRER